MPSVFWCAVSTLTLVAAYAPHALALPSLSGLPRGLAAPERCAFYHVNARASTPAKQDPGSGDSVSAEA